VLCESYVTAMLCYDMMYLLCQHMCCILCFARLHMTQPCRGISSRLHRCMSAHVVFCVCHGDSIACYLHVTCMLRNADQGPTGVCSSTCTHVQGPRGRGVGHVQHSASCCCGIAGLLFAVTVIGRCCVQHTCRMLALPWGRCVYLQHQYHTMMV
jgi:hypothetical protein